MKSSDKFPKMELDFSGEKRPELVRFTFQLSPKQKPIQKRAGSHGEDVLPWSPAIIAFSAFFLRYKLWALEGKPIKPYQFAAESSDNIVGSLANALEKPTWIESYFQFDSAGFPVFKKLFTGRNRSGRDKAQLRIILIDEEYLPPTHVHIVWDARTPATETLRRLIELVEKQWKSHRSKSVPTGATVVANSTANIATQCYPFEEVDAEANIFRQLKRLFAAQPGGSFDEFRSGHIYIHPLIERITSQLKKNRWCAIDGFGSTGKTTAALQIAVQHQEAGGRSFYVDLEKQTTRRFTSEVLSFTFNKANDRDALLVVDNAHCDSFLVPHLIGNWKRNAPRGQLLLVGNFGLAKTSSNSPSSEQLLEPLIFLHVRESEIAGVFRSATGRLGRQLELDVEVLKEWHVRFNQDLAGLVREVSVHYESWRSAGTKAVKPDTKERATKTPHFFWGMNKQAPDISVLETRILATSYGHLNQIVQSQLANKKFLHSCRLLFSTPSFAEKFASKSVAEQISNVIALAVFSEKQFSTVWLRALFLSLLNREPESLIRQIVQEFSAMPKNNGKILRFLKLCEKWMDPNLRYLLFRRVGSPSQIELGKTLLGLFKKDPRPLTASLRQLFDRSKDEAALAISALEHPLIRDRLVSKFRYVRCRPEDSDEFLKLVRNRLSSDTVTAIVEAIHLRIALEAERTAIR